MTREALSAPIAYQEWPARPDLRRYVQCVWMGGPGGPAAEPVLPDGCMDVIWNGTRLFVAGPDTVPVEDAHEGPFAVGIRFRPGAGPLFLGVPAATLRDARVDLEQLWPVAGRLADHLAGAPGTGHPAGEGSLAAAAGMIEGAVACRVGPELEPDPVVEDASRRWRVDPTSLSLATLTLEAGLTGRQLHRRFVQAVGYGPKRLQRILRFQSFLRSTASGRWGLAELAARCGYADQAHLTRETAELAGRTPAQLVAARAPDVRFVQDGPAPGR